MRTFNKIVTIIGLLLAFVLLPVIAAIPADIIRVVRDIGFSIESWLSPGAHLLVAAVAVVLWLVTLALLWLEFRPARTVIKVAAVEGGEATVTAYSVARHLEQSLTSIPAVREVRAWVRQEREGVAANLSLSTGPDVNVPSVTAAAISLARGVLENHIGARVSRVNVQVQHGTAKARREAVTPAPASVARPEQPSVVSAPAAEVAAVPPPVFERPSVAEIQSAEPAQMWEQPDKGAAADLGRPAPPDTAPGVVPEELAPETGEEDPLESAKETWLDQTVSAVESEGTDDSAAG